MKEYLVLYKYPTQFKGVKYISMPADSIEEASIVAKLHLAKENNLKNKLTDLPFEILQVTKIGG